MLRRTPAPLFLSGVVLALTGCPMSTTTSMNIPIEDLGDEYAAASCDVIADCYGEEIRDLFTGQSGAAACEANAARSYREVALPLYEQAILDGTLTYDETQARACVDALRALGCGLTSARSPAACRATLSGNVAPGGACSINEQCSGDAYCRNSTACPGTCQARGATSATCVGNDDCQSGLVCAGGSCAAPAGAGASCQGSTDLECAGGLICAGGSATEVGVCRAVDTVFSGALDGACNVQMGQLCQPSLSCVVQSLTSQSCGARVATGGACHLAFPDQCESGAYCDGVGLMPLDFDGTCLALPTAGMACTAAMRCASGLRCAAGTCAAVHEVGGSCEVPEDCYSGTCTGGTCVEPMLCS